MKGSMSDFVNKHQPVPQSYQPVPQSSDPFILAESGDSALLILRSRAGDFVTLPSQRGEDSDFSHPGNIGAVPLDGLWRLRPKPTREFPRLCRGGSKSLTYPEVGP